MPSFESPRTPLQPTDRANRSPRVSDSSIRKTTPTAARTTPAKKDTRFKNVMPRSPGRHEHQVYEYDDRHCDPELFHELVEEPDVVFGDDIDALGVTHAGVPDTPEAVRKSPQVAQQGNATRQARQGQPQQRRADPDVHCDPRLFHELVEEPDDVFADDIRALGVTHAGRPDPPKRRTIPAGSNKQANQPKRYPRATRRTAPSAEDLHWDSDVMHEVVEEPDDIFGDDIDALGVHHAGVPERPSQKAGNAQANEAKRYARARRRNAPSAEDLHWDSDVMHEVVEEPDDIFADDIDALGVRRAGVPDKPPASSRKKPARVITRRLRRAAPNSNDLVWDADIIHEVVEEPEFIFGDDIDALGVKRAGVPDQHQPRNAKRKVRVRRVGRPSAEDLRWDVGVMHEIVEDPDAIFGEDIDALGVTHAGVSDSPRPSKPTARRVVRKAGGKPAHGGSRHRLKRQHADPRLFHELVEEPDAIFGDDIDALGVAHAGVPDDSAGKGINISANGIQLNLQTTREGTTVTIKLPKTQQ